MLVFEAPGQITQTAAGHLLSAQFYQNYPSLVQALELGYKSNVEHLTPNIENCLSVDHSVDQLYQIVLQFREVSVSSSYRVLS